MRSTASIALVALLASPAFAAPLATSERRNINHDVVARAPGAAPVVAKPAPAPAPAAAKPAPPSSGLGTALAGSAVGGAVSATVSNILNKIESLFRRDEMDGSVSKRDVSALSDILGAVPSLSADDKQTVKTALVNKISTLQNVSRRGAGAAIGGAAVGGAASALVGNLLSEIEKLFRRHEEFADVERRSPLFSSKPASSTSSSGGTGTAILGSAVGGAASGVVSNLLGEIESLFRRDEELGAMERRSPLFSSKPSSSSTSSGGTGTAILGSAVGGAASGVVSNLLGEIESLFRREEELVGVQRRSPLFSSKPSSSSGGTGTALLGSAAGGAASGIVSNLLGQIEGLFSRDEMAKRDVSALSDILKAVPSLSSDDKQTVKTALMNKIGTLQDISQREELDGTQRRSPQDSYSPSSESTSGPPPGEDSGESRGPGGSSSGFPDSGESTPPSGNEIDFSRRDDSALNARAPLGTVKPAAAAPAKAPGIGTTVASSAVGGAVSATVGNLLNQIEGLFSRSFDEEDYAKRDVSALSGILSAVPSLSADDKQTVKTALMNKISTLQTPASRKARRGIIGSAAGSAAGGLTSVASNTIVSDLLNKIESLFRRSEVPMGDKMRRADVLDKLAGMQRRSPLFSSKPSSSTSSSGGTGTAILGSAVGGAASGVVSNLLGQIESLFSRSETLDELLERSEFFDINELD